MRLHHRSVYVLLALGLVSAVWSQTTTNKAALISLSKVAATHARNDRADAVRLAKLLGYPVIVKNGSLYMEIERFFGRQPIYRTTLGLEAAKTTLTNELWPGGTLGLSLTGVGEVIRHWDGGTPRTTHQEFGGRVFLGDAEAASNHSTAVAGMMIAAGIDASSKGMSYGGSVKSFGWNDDTSEMAIEAANGMLLSNHSYGFTTVGIWQYGFYDSYSEAWDTMQYNAPYYLICQSSGNDQSKNNGKGIYESIIMPASAKNMLTVGSVYPISGGFSGDLTKIVISPSSSCGPTDDGRIKPDVVGCGQNVYCPTYNSDSSYGTWGGNLILKS